MKDKIDEPSELGYTGSTREVDEDVTAIKTIVFGLKNSVERALGAYTAAPGGGLQAEFGRIRGIISMILYSIENIASKFVDSSSDGRLNSDLESFIDAAKAKLTILQGVVKSLDIESSGISIGSQITNTITELTKIENALPGLCAHPTKDYTFVKIKVRDIKTYLTRLKTATNNGSFEEDSKEEFACFNATLNRMQSDLDEAKGYISSSEVIVAPKPGKLDAILAKVNALTGGTTTGGGAGGEVDSDTITGLNNKLDDILTAIGEISCSGGDGTGGGGDNAACPAVPNEVTGQLEQIAGSMESLQDSIESKLEEFTQALGNLGICGTNGATCPPCPTQQNCPTTSSGSSPGIVEIEMPLTVTEYCNAGGGVTTVKSMVLTDIMWVLGTDREMAAITIESRSETGFTLVFTGCTRPFGAPKPTTAVSSPNVLSLNSNNAPGIPTKDNGYMTCTFHTSIPQTANALQAFVTASVANSSVKPIIYKVAFTNCKLLAENFLASTNSTRLDYRGEAGNWSQPAKIVRLKVEKKNGANFTVSVPNNSPGTGTEESFRKIFASFYSNIQTVIKGKSPSLYGYVDKTQEIKPKPPTK